MKKKFTVLALAFAMVLTMSATVFAADPTPDTVDSTTTKTNAEHQIAITKDLAIGAGITVPDLSFTFVAAPGSERHKNDAGYISKTADYPALFGTSNEQTVTYASTDRANGSTDENLVKQGATVDLDDIDFDHAGLYVYTVTEKVPANADANGVVAIDEDTNLTYDKDSVYYLKVYVRNPQGTETKPQIEDVQVANEAGEKLDAVPGDSKPSEDKDGDKDFNNDGNDFVFSNTYTKNVKTNPDDPAGTETGAFKLSKTVEGKYADQSQDFVFTVVLTLPKTAAAYSATNPAPKLGTADGVISNGGKTVTYSEVKLHHGQDAKIATLPMGSKVSVTEGAFADYYPSVDARGGENGAVATYSVSESNKSIDLPTNGEILIGDKGGVANYTNRLDNTEATPTGIIINNLPYVLLIGLALGGIVLFSRKRRYE